MSGFKPYPAYKDSGVEWLGEVPEDWVVKKLKREIVAQSGTDQKYDGGDFPLFGANGVIGETNTSSVKSPCVLIGRVGSAGEINFISQAAGVSDNALIVSNQIFNIPRYDFYLFHAMDIKSSVSKNAQPLITASSFRDRIVAVPMDFCERLQIARFLDHETARIDALIEEQQRLIELLKEKRQAVISQAVTKGLDPTVPMKDSGVEWLGEVPEHWGIGALGYFAGIDTGATPDRGSPGYWGGDIPWIKTGEVNYENISQAEEHITREGVKNSAAKVAPKGTLLMAMYGQGVTRGRVAILDIEAAYNQACAGIFVDSRIRVEYLRLFFIAAYPYIRDGGNETSQMNLSSGHIAKIKITVPPISEQMSVEHFLNTEMVRFDSLINEAGLLANHLQERRSALISAAVTGKIDVRGWQPPVSAVGKTIR